MRLFKSLSSLFRKNPGATISANINPRCLGCNKQLGALQDCAPVTNEPGRYICLACHLFLLQG